MDQILLFSMGSRLRGNDDLEPALAKILRVQAMLFEQDLQVRAVHVPAPRKFRHRAADIFQAALQAGALGAATGLELDEIPVQVSDGDVFLLCSDGLSNAVSPEDMFNALTVGDCAQAAETLIELALAAGGRDNISVVVVRADEVEADQTVMNPSL